MKVSFNVENQIITRSDGNVVIANSIDYLEVDVTFTADWTNATKTIQLRNGDIVLSAQLVNNKLSQDKHINLTVGTWKVCIIGYDGDTRIVTNEANLAVYASGKDRISEAYKDIIADAVDKFIDDNADEILYRLLNESGVSFGKVDDVKVNDTSVVANRIANIPMSDYLSTKQDNVIYGLTEPTSSQGENNNQYGH